MVAIPKPRARDAWPILAREIVSLHFILFLLIGLAMPFWMPAAIYAALWTYFWSPSGLITWCLALGLGGSAAYHLIRFLRKALMRAKAMKLLRRAADAGDELAPAMYLRLRSQPLGWWHFGIFLSLQLLIPVAVAIAMWPPIPTLVRDQGRLRRATQQEALARELTILKSRGLLKPLGSD